MMLRSCWTSSYISRIKQIPRISILQNVRWSTAVSVDFDDAALAAAKPFEEIPAMAILPVVGSGWIYMPIIGHFELKRLGEALHEKKKLLGDIYREKFGKLNMVTSYNPDDLQIMYKHEGAYPIRNDLESLTAYREIRKHWFSTMGLTLLNGKEWWDFRTKTQKHLMKPKAVQAFLDPMQDVARDLVEKIRVVRDANREVPDALGELYKWSLESVGLVGLDTRLGCLDTNLSPDSDGMKMIKSVHTMFECINKLEAFSGKLQWWKMFPTPTWKKFVEVSDTFTEIAFKHIYNSLEKLKNATDEDQDLTLLQSLLMEKGMDASSAMVLVQDMLMAGIDTTSNTMGFFLYDMAKNLDKQELLYQDLKSILPRKEDRITPSIFNELKYLKACMKESQRLNPVVGVHVRIVDHDLIFSGYRVPAGTILLIGIQGIYRDEKYFSNPEKFQPERWLKKDEKFHPYAFLPFGFGVRSCIGRRLAELEMICLAAQVIRNFRVEYHHEDIGMYTRLVNVPDKPLRLKFIER